MTRCENIQLLLALRPDDRSVTEERRVQAHLAICADCAARAKAYAEQDRVIRNAPPVALTQAQRGQLVSTIERKRRRQEMRGRLFTLAGATATVLAAVGFILVTRFLLPADVGRVPGRPAASTTQEAPADHGDEVTRRPQDTPEEPTPSSEPLFQWPTSRREISGWTFHDPRHPDHPGIDIAAEAGDPVYAVAVGQVSEAGWRDDGRGYTLVVEHADGWSSTYAQLDEVVVDVGQTVSQGELVGRAGSTGESSGPHLHFELHYHGQAVNPLDHLPSQPDLRDLLLREEELPGTGLDEDDWEPEAIYLHGDDWVSNLAQADGCLEALKVEGFREVDEDEAGVYVWHGVYRFEEAGQAIEQYEALLAGDMLDSGEILYQGAGRGRMQATAVVFTGSEGEAIYWLFGVEDTVLHVLMVDSFWYEHAREIFEATVSRFVPLDLARELQDVEVELAKLFVDDPDGQCGWEVLGESDMESYVWAICQSPGGTAVSAPAVVHWETSRRTATKIQIPRDGSFYGEDVRLLFPPEIRERILDHEVDMDAIWRQMERDLTTVTGTVVDNAASAEVVTLEDQDGEQWHIPWRASRGVRWPDGSAAEFRDIERGLRVEVVGFRRDATTPNVLSAVRVTMISESIEATRPAPAAILDRERAIAHSLNLLREQGIERAHDGAVFAPIRFPDGEQGAFVAIGFSGIAEGYQLLYRVENGDVDLVDLVDGPIDWGIWSLGDFETVDLAFPDLFPGE